MNSRIANHRMVLMIIIAAFMVPAISPAQNLKCFILTPPEQLLEGVKQVAITDFAVTTSYHSDEAPGKEKKGVIGFLEKVSEAGKSGQRFTDSGVKLTDMMIAMLLEDDRGIREVGSGFLGLGKKEGRSFQQGARTNVFGVVERTRLQQVMSELQLGQSGIVNEAQAAQVGQLLGVDAIITGNLSVSCEDRWVKENREDKKKGKYQVNCNQRVASASGTIRIIKVETGQVIGSKQSNHKEELKKCEGEWGKDLPTPETTVDACLNAVARELVDYFAPRFEQQKLEFAKIEGDEYKRFYETAKNALERYDIDTAYLQYAAIAEQDPYNHAALFNLGVLYDAVGDYKHAQEKYAMAARLKSKEDKYIKAQARVARQLAFWDKLNALGIYIQERTFEVSAEQVQAAGVAKIQVSGSSSERFEIKAEPNPASQTLLRVPGEIELELIQDAGDWYKIKLLDGREGFIAKKNAKMLK
ncbi:MAG: CsgG/HfaB family protein [candidate division KSB1 bacterium]|nr:CsgG/HfaB family protein [candidate division KSB1 bacterium]MDZ7302929.1 CsgG/HfaB family protein [candidate division KSB1 bacterium]MDZ7312205.1 CsgG/HfaB family protein [candidate division KSB1 bacterium]